jgi:hypothetical protein
MHLLLPDKSSKKPGRPAVMLAFCLSYDFAQHLYVRLDAVFNFREVDVFIGRMRPG